MSVDIGQIITTATTIINAVVAAAPAIEQGAADISPYIKAIVGLATGQNVTQEQIDEIIAQVNASSAEFQEPLPDDPLGETQT